MLDRKELLKIAMDYAMSGKYILDNLGRPRFRIGYDTNLVGRFIPLSAYYSIDSIESMTTFEMRDAGIFNNDDLIFINEMAKISIFEDYEWLEIIKEKINE